MKKLLQGTCIVLILVALMVGISFAQEIKLRGQCSHPPGTFDYICYENIVKRIAEVTEGKVKLELLAPGTIVPAFEVLDAVNKGVLDFAASWIGYWVGKNSAFTLFASATGGPFGMDNWDVLAWYYFGDGKKLLDELFEATGYTNVVNFLAKGEFPEPLGWFPKQVTKYEDLKGYKMRVAGMAAEVFKEAGVSVVTVPGGEILPLLERKAIDATEYSDPHSDLLLGIPDVLKFYHAPGVHQPTGFMGIHFNKKKWETLPKEVRNTIELVCHEMVFKNTLQEWMLGVEALEKMEKEFKVQVVKTPEDVLLNLVKAWDTVAAKEAEKNPLFKKIFESQKAWASKYVPFRQKFFIDYSVIANYYWGKK
ncbi:MAG: TRAP transporter substrate-binding protein [Synergistetes bacterium]|nr:TRAP transporter substrate-binding protein [Synergistota bacterium]MDW8193154.1 TRAP transporter substrate-binding protein [Synergistota bacterium]